MFYEVYLAGQWMWNIPLLVIFLGILAVYFLVAFRSENIKQAFLFIFGLSLLYIINGTPLAAISHLSFSTHMIQMSIQFFVVPPLLLLGIPRNIYYEMIHTPAMTTIRKLLPPPTVSLSLFALLFLLYHMPFILTFLSEHSLAMDGYTFLLFVLSFRMWRPITGPAKKELLGDRRRKRFAWLSGILLMPACLFFIVAAILDGVSNPFLTHTFTSLCLPSASGTLLPPLFNTRIDQVMAGVLMLTIHKLGMLMTFYLRHQLENRS